MVFLWWCGGVFVFLWWCFCMFFFSGVDFRRITEKLTSVLLLQGKHRHKFIKKSHLLRNDA